MSDYPLRRVAAKAFGWNVVGSVFRSFSGFAVNVILSRLLGPEPFGAMAVVLTLLGFSTLVLDSGLSTSLIQRKDLLDEDIDTVQTIQILVGVVLSVFIWLLAYSLSSWFEQPELVVLAPWLATMIILTAISQVPVALLRRRLEFETVQQGQIVSYTLGYILVGIPMGFLGFGIWSLIAAQLVQLVVGLLWVVWKTRRLFRPRLSGDRNLLTFGLRVLGTNVINWLTINFDTFVVGLQLGSATLGVYNRMTFLLGTPLNILTSSIQPVMVSSVARVQTERRKVKEAYLSVVELVAWIALPLFLSLAFIGSTLVEAIYGDLWVAGNALVAPMCTFMAIASLGMLPGPVLTGLGRVDVELRTTAVNLLVSLSVIALAALHSAVFVAWAVAFSRLSFCVFLNRALARRLELGLGEYLSRTIRPLMGALLLGGSMWLLDMALSRAGLHSLFRLLLLAAFGAGVYGGVFLKFPERVLGQGAQQLLLELGPYRKVRNKIIGGTHRG